MDKPHKNLVAWKAALDLMVDVYRETERFPRRDRFGIADQARRAALSVPSNIAEGAARNTKKEFARFLFVAKGSLSELDTQLEVAKKLGYLEANRWSHLDQQLIRIDRLLSGLVQHTKAISTD